MHLRADISRMTKLINRHNPKGRNRIHEGSIKLEIILVRANVIGRTHNSCHEKGEAHRVKQPMMNKNSLRDIPRGSRQPLIIIMLVPHRHFAHRLGSASCRGRGHHVHAHLPQVHNAHEKRAAEEVANVGVNVVKILENPPHVGAIVVEVAKVIISGLKKSLKIVPRHYPFRQAIKTNLPYGSLK